MLTRLAHAGIRPPIKIPDSTTMGVLGLSGISSDAEFDANATLCFLGR